MKRYAVILLAILVSIKDKVFQHGLIGLIPDVALDGFVGRNGDGGPLVGGGFTVGAGAGGGGAISVTWTKVIPLFKFGGRGCQDTKDLPPPRPRHLLQLRLRHLRRVRRVIFPYQ